MSIAVRTPPRSSEDRDAKFINFTEDFRRAKRTTLTWSALTIFVAFAPQWSSATRFMGNTIPYPQEAMGVLLLLVATFYFSSYIRALGLVKTQNSQAAQETEAVWNDLKSVLKGIKIKIAGPESATQQIIQESENIRKVFSNFSDITEKALKGTSIVAEDHRYELARENFRRYLKEPPRNMSLPKEFERFLEISTSRTSTYFEAVERYHAQMSDQVVHLDNFDAHRSAQLARIEAGVDLLEQSLTRFRDSIDAPEKRWHRWHDQVIPIGLFAIAFFASTTVAIHGPILPMVPQASMSGENPQSSPGTQSPRLPDATSTALSELQPASTGDGSADTSL